MNRISKQVFNVLPSETICGDIVVPGDKSISHRAVILSAISNHKTIIENILVSDDVLSTINIMRELGVKINLKNTICEIHGVGLHGLKQSKNVLNCGNSGTSMRLLAGLLSAQKFNSILIGDESLMKRPMLRVAEPLRLMGAAIHLSEKNTAPIEIIGNPKLTAIDYELLIPSAQVKSAILLAGLYAEGETIVREKIPTRDHTEKMMQLFGNFSAYPSFQKGVAAEFSVLAAPTEALPLDYFLTHDLCNKTFQWDEMKIPGDISSAAFFIVLAAITHNADITIRQVGVNPFRTGIISILKLMGANIAIFNETLFGLEPVADIRIQYAPLHGIEIPSDLISKSIDEFPAIFIAAVTAKGKTILRGASELRVKESDRIAAMVNGLRSLGIHVEEFEDGLCVEGSQVFRGGKVDACGDHRIAMSFVIAANIAKESVVIDDGKNIATSFPNFLACCNLLGMSITIDAQ